MQGCLGSSTVWLAAAGAEFTAVDQAQTDGPAGAGGSSAFDVQAAACMFPGA